MTSKVLQMRPGPAAGRAVAAIACFSAVNDPSGERVLAGISRNNLFSLKETT
jgi:hypothetical protein